MDQFILPASPNWQLSSVLACSDNGLLAYGSRSDVSIINFKPNGKLDVSILQFAHKDRLTAIVFSPVDGIFKNCLATCGDDGMVRVWNFEEGRLLYFHTGHKDGLKVVGLDWSRADTNRLVSVSDLGSIVCWDLRSNTTRRLHCGVKVLPLTLACCPHDQDLVAIGCKGGVTLVVDIKGTGKIVHRLRGLEHDVISISWCPVPYNVIKHKRNVDSKVENTKEVKTAEVVERTMETEQRDLLLATGGVDKSIFIWRAGSDGRYEVVLSLPNNSVNSHFPRKKGYPGSINTMLWTCVHWVDAYTLLSTSQFGELLSWDLSKVSIKDKSNTKKLQPRLLHSRHYKGCFAIACPVIYDAVTNWEAETRNVWTTAMDKHVVACSLGSGKIVLDIPTMGGAVYAMALSPLDPNRLAIGSSDSKVFVWNMSDLTSLSIVSYWKKIIGKVMSLCWHPSEENWLAYGTSDGHVGLIDVSSNKTPTLFRLHHRKAVYRICWAPPVLKPDDAEINKTKLVLYSLGDGDIFQYTDKPEESNEEPKSLNTALLNSFDKSLGLQNSLIRSDIVFKPDSTCFAIGSENGSVYIVSCETLKLLHTVYPHKKLMNNLEWHPETVACDNSISPYKDWLAITCENIKVYNIPAEGQPELVATLSGHSEKIVGLSWSPHYNGRLLSASYDHSVQIWDVPSQKCLGVYQGHSMAVMCALFNPLNPDMVISGSSDNSVRHWSISQLAQKPVTKPAKKKERQGALDKERAGAEEATELIVGMSQLAKKEESNTSKQNSATNTSPPTKQPGSVTDKSMEEYKKRLKGRAVFTVTGSNITQARHFDVLYDRWNKTTNPVSTLDNDLSESAAATTTATEIGYLDFFGDDQAMQRLLMVEETRLMDNKHYALAQTSVLWRGEVSQMIQEAITKKKLSDWLVSMAPLAGYEVWEEACAAYAKQLAECGDVLKASSYLLANHNVHEAVRLLADHKMFKEAVAVAKCRLSLDDELTSKVYTEWGDYARAQGNLTLAVHCYWAARNFQLCIETLVRIKELKYLKMAAVIAKFHNYTELANSLALDCLLMSISVSNPAVGYHILEQFPGEEYKHWTVWLKVSEVLSKVKNRGERELFDWLEGRQKTQVSLPDELTKVFSSLCESFEQDFDKKYSPKKEEVEINNPHDRIPAILSFIYSRLQPHLPTNKNPEFERDLWFYLSGQLTGAFVGRLGCAPSRFLRHLVAALSAAFHYQTHHPSSLALPIIVSIISPAGIFAENSIFTMEYKTDKEAQLAKSLRAFVCASIVQWMNNNWEKVVELRSKREEKPAENGSGVGSQGVELQSKREEKPAENGSGDGSQGVELRSKHEEKPAENGSGDGSKGVELYRMDWLPELITRCSSDVLDEENVSYFVKKALKEELQNTVTKENIHKKITMEKNVDCNKAKQNKVTNKSQTVSEPADDKTNGSSSVESQTSKKDVEESKKENLNSAQNKGDSIVPEKAKESTPLPNDQEQKNTAELKSNKTEKAKEQESVPANKTLNECSEDAHKLLQKTGKETKPATSIVQNGDTSTVHSSQNCDTTTVHSSQNGDAFTTNGTDSHGESDENIELKIKEIKEIDGVIQKFETTRVTVPSPFTAYMNIKYLIDNLVTKQDSKLAQHLQENCDKIWKKSHH